MPENDVERTTAGGLIVRAAGTVMAAFIISNLVGLFAKTLTARAFGTGFESNSFFAANRFSEILFNLVAGGALGSAFIPVFTGMLVNQNQARAWKLASAISNLVSTVLILLSILTILFSRQIVHYILAPGFSVQEEILTAKLLQIQILSSVIFGLSGLIMGILNSHQHFLLPAIAPAFYQLGWVLGIYLLVPKIGIFGLAWGVVIGSFLHLVVQIPLLIKLPQWRYQVTYGLEMQETRIVGRLMAPRLLGVAVVQLNFLLNTILASFQKEGSITAIGLAFPLMIMPEAAIAQSIAIAALPTFSTQVAQNKMNEMRATLSGSLRGALILSIPAMIGLIVLRVPVVQILYERGTFTPDSTQMVAWALLWYATGLVSHSIVEIISRAFYALHDTRTPVLIGIGAMSLNLLFSFIFTRIFELLGWMPHGGLALANTAATTLEATLLAILMRDRLHGLHGRETVYTLLKTGFAGGLMGAGIWYGFQHTAFSSLAVTLITAIISGISIYFIVLLLLRDKALQEFLSLIMNKFKNQ